MSCFAMATRFRIYGGVGQIDRYSTFDVIDACHSTAVEKKVRDSRDIRVPIFVE